MNFKLKVAYSKGLVIISLKEVQRDYSASPDGVQASQTTPTAEALVSQKKLISTPNFLLRAGSSHPGVSLTVLVELM